MASNDNETRTTPSAESASGRAHTAKPERLAVSELAASFAGSPSPFGDDVTFPLPFDDLTYRPQVDH